MTKWLNKDAGPIQVKRIDKALSQLRWEASTFVEITGVVGGRQDKHTVTAMFGGTDDRKEEAAALADKIGARYGFTITKANAKEIVKDLEGARVFMAANRPEKDTRSTAEEDHARQLMMQARTDQHKSASEARKQMADQVMAKAPAGAHAVIVAAYKADNSDIQSDYFNNVAVRTVAIGWRYSKREDFKALAAAARGFKDTVNVTFTEHRDNYSMGKGNYLSDHGWDGSGSGWVIKSLPLPLSTWADLTEDALPEHSESPASENIDGEGFTVSASSLGRAGVVEVRFDTKPSLDVLEELKASGFRWARGNRCWYGQASRLPQRFTSFDQLAGV